MREIGAEEIPMITVLNKIDRLVSADDLEALLKLYPESVPVSAVNRTGLDDLCTRIVGGIEKAASWSGQSNTQQTN